MADRIVCLDGYTLNPGDIEWKPFEELGELKVYERTPEEQIVARAAGAKAVLINKVALSDQTLAQLPDLKYIGVLATGYNVVDTAAAKQRGVVVTNVPTYGTDSVAQHAAALMLELSRRICVHSRAVRDGAWTRNADWCFSLAPITELTGRTLGIVGLGRIGLALARIAAAMGMKLIAFDAFRLNAQQLGGLEVRYVEDVDQLFAESDVISLHCPLTEQTRHLVNTQRLAKMKRTAFVINTARGPLIDNHALAAALRDGQIGGAGLDVLDVEPPPADNPLLDAPNCIVTPHIAWYGRDARRRLMQIAADNLRGFQSGKPANVVN